MSMFAMTMGGDMWRQPCPLEQSSYYQKICKKIIKNTQKIGKIIKKYMKLTKFH